MNKIISFIVFCLVLTIELMGAVYTFQLSLRNTSNLKIAAGLYGVLVRDVKQAANNINKGIDTVAKNDDNCLVFDIKKPVYNSVVEYMKSQKLPATFEDRLRLANKYGVGNYVGSAKQNIGLIDMLSKDLACQKSRPISIK